MFLLLQRGLDDEPARLDLLKKGDWFGIGIMAIGLEALELMLEEETGKTGSIPSSSSKRPGSPASSLSASSSCSSGKGAAGQSAAFQRPEFCRRMRGEHHPRHRPFRQRLPRSTVSRADTGYSAFQIGEVMMWLGIPQLFVVPIVLRLSARVDTRFLLGFGCLLFSISAAS